MVKQEIMVASVSGPGEVIPLGQLLEKGIIPKNIGKLQLAFSVQREENLDFLRQNFCHLINLTFPTNIQPENIHCRVKETHPRDSYYAEYFGYTTRSLANASLVNGELEVWIESVFLSKKHPLAKTGAQNAVFFKNLSPEKAQSETTPILRQSGEMLAGYYLRLRTQDEPLVLAAICEKFASLGISLRGVRQPETEAKSTTAEIAFLTWPFATWKMSFLEFNLNHLPVCKKIEAVFRLIP